MEIKTLLSGKWWLCFPYDALSQVELVATSLFLVNFNDIIIFHFQLFRCFIIVDPPSVKQESKRSNWYTNSFTVRLFQLPHLCCHFHSEMDFIRILTNNLQLNILGSGISSIRLLIISHFERNLFLFY